MKQSLGGTVNKIRVSRPGFRRQLLTAAGVLGAMASLGSLGAFGQVLEGWAPQDPPGQTPPAQYLQGVAHDAARGETVMFGIGGETWVWDGLKWALVSPHLPDSRCRRDLRPVCDSPGYLDGRKMAYDEERQEIVMLGGSANSPAQIAASRKTWTWDGTSWTEKNPFPLDRSVNRHSMAYDAARKKVVMVEGLQAVSNSMKTWTWDGTNWSDVTPAQNRPPSRVDSALVYDPARCQTLMFGGSEINPAGSKNHTLGPVGDSLADTWIWDGSGWSQPVSLLGAPPVPVLSPPARSWHGMAFDSIARRVVMFGGLTLGVAPAPGTVGGGVLHRNDTWLWDGVTWRELPSAQTPAPRYGPAMAYHAPQSHTVLFGGRTGIGNTQARSVGDTWTLESSRLPESPVAPRFSIADASIVEGNDGPSELTLKVSLSPSTCVETSVYFSTSDGAAIAPGDYTSTSGTLPFTSGQSVQEIKIPIVGDVVDEADEEFFVNLAGAQGASIDVARAKVTILDDDQVAASSPPPPPPAGPTPEPDPQPPGGNPPAPPVSSSLPGASSSGSTTISLPQGPAPPGPGGGGGSPVVNPSGSFSSLPAPVAGAAPAPVAGAAQMTTPAGAPFERHEPQLQSQKSFEMTSVANGQGNLLGRGLAAASFAVMVMCFAAGSTRPRAGNLPGVAPDVEQPFSPAPAPAIAG